MTTRSRLALSAALVCLALVAACGGGSSPSASPTVEATASPTPEATPSPTDVATPSPTEAATPTASVDTAVQNAWRATATQYRGMNGEQFDFDCPAGGEVRSVWGTDIYTDDSSVCTAGVHAGVITLEEGGAVTIEIRPGEDEYEDSERNGIESLPYPAWGGSFVVIVAGVD